MRKIIKDQQIVDNDWQQVNAEEPIPAGDVIVPFSRWNAEQETLLTREGRLGVCLYGDDNTRDIATSLQHFDVVAIDFPKFADGRGYSHARILRDEIGYKGELRAVGDILRDQIFYLARCGFNAFVVRKDKDLEDALEGLKDFTVTYQAAADNPNPIYRR